jgi:ribulose-5-phosphate 4-epimerase/fuculose-1-phosphate aldolase
MNELERQKQDLVVANRILAQQGITDALGHVSFRHPENPERYVMSQSRSPALVTEKDLMDFRLDGEPLDQRGRPMYTERPIHGGIYEKRPDVTAVIHNHAQTVIPFGVSDAPLRPIAHMAAAIGEEVPVWDIRDQFGDTNLLVTTMDQGRDLAKQLGDGPAVLMRGHGCAVAGRNLREAVLVAVYLHINAKLLAESLQLGKVTYLSPGEVKAAAKIIEVSHALDRIWEYWAALAGCGEGLSPVNVQVS